MGEVWYHVHLNWEERKIRHLIDFSFNQFMLKHIQKLLVLRNGGINLTTL